MQDVNRQTLDVLKTLCQQLLAASISPPEFFRTLLPRVVDESGLLAAAVWLNDDHGRLRLVAEHQIASLSNSGQFYVDQEHQAVVEEVMRQIKVRILPDRPVSGEMRPHTLTIGPIVKGDVGAGAIELFSAPQGDASTQATLRELVELLSGYGSKAMSPTDLVLPKLITPDSGPAQPPEFWEQFDRFVLGVQRLDVSEMAANAVNDGRLLLACDRVSLAVQEGKRIRIRAVSGEEAVHQRANLVRKMTNLAEVVMKGGEPVTYTGSGHDLPPPVEQPMADYLAESRMRMVALVPLFDSRDSGDSDETSKRQEKPRQVVGCLIVEQATESEPRRGLLQRVELIRPHVANALADAEQHESILLLPLWRVLGRVVRWFRGRRLLAASAVLGLLVAVGIGLAVIPWTYRVEGTGKAMPVTRYDIFAPENGDVVQVLVKGGEQVQSGAPLIILQNRDLEAEIVATTSAVNERTSQAEALSLQAQDASAHGQEVDAIRFRGEELRARTEAEGLAGKLKVFRERAERLTIRAPAAGVVATFQAEQLLRDRPVQRGEKLLEVMDDAGDWRIELEIPEHRMGHLLKAMHDSDAGVLIAEYVPATAVELTLPAEVHAAGIATRSNQSQEEGAIVEVYARIDAEKLPGRRIGAEVTAKVDCGKRSLFYVLFGDVVEFVQRHVWW